MEGPFIWWWWFWPIHCHREEIATTRTDQCGSFCVWIPRWDIDRILRFRQRICFPEIVRPTLRDILDEIRILVSEPPFPDPPNPPDPPPFVVPHRGVLAQVGERLGRPGRSTGSAQFAERRSFGQQTGEMTALLDEPAFLDTFPPPLTDVELKQLETLDLKERLSERFDKAKLELAELSPIKAIGPFLRCRDVYVAEWEYFFDVPDITFRVTQDVDGDGDEELIYSEGFFDVRWNAGPIPNVTLQASPIARSVAVLRRPGHPVRQQARDRDRRPDAAGRVAPQQRDRARDAREPPASRRPVLGRTGLAPARRRTPARCSCTVVTTSPVRSTTACSTRHGATRGPVPRRSSWYPPKLTGPPWWYHAAPDGQGWYEVLPEAELVFPHWLLSWPTTNFPNGQYDVRLELADASKIPLAAPSDVQRPGPLHDRQHRQPLAGFTQIRWRVAGAPSYLPENTYTWPFVCIVDRAAQPAQTSRSRSRGRRARPTSAARCSAPAAAAPATRSLAGVRRRRRPGALARELHGQLRVEDGAVRPPGLAAPGLVRLLDRRLHRGRSTRRATEAGRPRTGWPTIRTSGLTRRSTSR